MPAEIIPYDPEKWDFDDLPRKIAKMALDFITPEGCISCTNAKTSRRIQSSAVARGEKSLREALDTHSLVFNSLRCVGQKPVEIKSSSSDCMPEMECGQKRSPEIEILKSQPIL